MKYYIVVRENNSHQAQQELNFLAQKGFTYVNHTESCDANGIASWTFILVKEEKE